MGSLLPAKAEMLKRYQKPRRHSGQVGSKACRGGTGWSRGAWGAARVGEMPGGRSQSLSLIASNRQPYSLPFLSKDATGEVKDSQEASSLSCFL